MQNHGTEFRIFLAQFKDFVIPVETLTDSLRRDLILVCGVARVITTLDRILITFPDLKYEDQTIPLAIGREFLQCVSDYVRQESCVGGQPVRVEAFSVGTLPSGGTLEGRITFIADCAVQGDEVIVENEVNIRFEDGTPSTARLTTVGKTSSRNTPEERKVLTDAISELGHKEAQVLANAKT